MANVACSQWQCLVCVGGEAAASLGNVGEEEVEGEPYWLFCRQCLLLLPRTFYSSNQLRTGKNRCMTCVGNAVAAAALATHWGHHLHVEAAAYHPGFSGLAMTHNMEKTLPDLPEEPNEILLVNSSSSGAHAALCAEAEVADLVALDAEWEPDRSETDDNPISVLQFAFPATQRVYVVQLGCLDGRLPGPVSAMLADPEVTKVGFAVDGKDVEKFKRSAIKISNGSSLIDIQERCEAALGLYKPPFHVGLKWAAEELLGFYRLKKDKRISCSNWALPQLTAEQIRYAALDAWVTLRLFYGLAESGC